MSTTYAQKSSTVQKVAGSKAASLFDSSSQSESLQRKADMANNATQRAEAPRPNNTGMPDNLKSGIESLSGFSMDDVRVHYNSSKPATVQALAYTQGTDIHVAPGQEKHLPHEAWHVAQQMAGRVSPTTNINGMPVNDNAGLEHEADVMGEKAEKQTFSLQLKEALNKNVHLQKNVGQLAIGTHLESNMLNVVGEQHDESDSRREIEKNYAFDRFGKNNYWLEYQFRTKDGSYGDSPALRYIQAFHDLRLIMSDLFQGAYNNMTFAQGAFKLARRFYKELKIGTKKFKNDLISELKIDPSIFINPLVEDMFYIVKQLHDAKKYNTPLSAPLKVLESHYIFSADQIEILLNQQGKDSNSLNFERSIRMHKTANHAASEGIHGIWKIGDSHVTEIKGLNEPISYNLLEKKDFDKYFSTKIGTVRPKKIVIGRRRK